MKKFRPSLITVGLVVGGMGFVSLPAFAQEAEVEATQADANNDEIEKIEVKGFATSLIKSLNQKRFSDTVSEHISADDLGGLPDISIADALTRLPGITAVRTGGQAAEINIRGLAGGFVFSTLNGREQVSTSGTRSIEFDQYPSELIASGAVYKSPKASLIEGGVAGTVELKTASPLSMDKKHSFNMNTRGSFNDRAGEVSDAEEFGHRLSFAYQGKYLDDTLGVALGYARLFQPSVSTQFIGFAYTATQDLDGVAGDGDMDGPTTCVNCENISAGFGFQHQGGEETRDGYVAVIEWAPVDNFTMKADAFISKFDSEAFSRGYRVQFDGNTADIINPNIINNNVTGGTINRSDNGSTRVELINDDNRDFDKIENYGIAAQWQATEDLQLSFDISLSKAQSDFRNGLLWALVSEGAAALNPQLDENISIAYQLNGLDLPDVNFNQAADFTDLDKILVSQYGIYPFQNKDTLDAYKFDVKYSLDNDYFSSIEAGARYSDREYSNDRSVFEFGSDSSFPSNQPPLRLAPDMVEVVQWDGGFSYLPNYLSIDLDKALNTWFPEGVPQPLQTWGTGSSGVINSPNVGNNGLNSGPSTEWSVQQSGDVFEVVNAAYLMASIDTEIGELSITGNIGVRYVDSKQSSTALQPATKEIVIDDPNNPGETITQTVSAPELGAQNIVDDAGLINTFFRPVLITHTYSDVLPSINLNFHISDNSQIRFAAAKVMGRAPINRFAANASINVGDVFATQDPDSGEITLSTPTSKITGNSTNSPYLEPFYATQYDISYEYYFTETDGSFAVAAFYKDIESFIENIGTDPYNFQANGFSVPDSVDVDVFFPVPEEGGDAQPVLDAQGNQLRVSVPTENGLYTTAINNGEGGYIRGIELSYTQIYSFLPDVWSGLGLNASYSYTESEIQRTVGNGVFSSRLPGLSEGVANVALFWEYQGFTTRINGRWRDAFVSNQVGINNQTVDFDAETILDFQASYDVTENLSVLFQANNLTDAPTKSYFGDESLTGTIQFFGTQYFLGLTYSL